MNCSLRRFTSMSKIAKKTYLLYEKMKHFNKYSLGIQIFLFFD